MLWVDVALILILLLSLLLLATMLGSLWVCVPYVPTPRRVMRRMIELAEIQGTETVYDLGCGDARMLIEAKKQHPDIRAIGYELPLGIYLLAKLKVWLSKLPIEVHMRDFLKADLRDADVIFLYLIPEMMPTLAKKLQEEARPGIRIISHGFEFKERKPLTVERCPSSSWHIFSASGKKGPRIFVYRW